MDNSKIQTLNDLIRFGKTSEFSQPQISLYYIEDNIVFLDKLAYAPYSTLLKSKSTYVTLTDDEFSKYKYNPDLLSTELYETPNLSHLILFLNNCAVHEFNRKRILLLPPSEVATTLQDIIIHEQKRIKKSLAKILE